MNARIARFAIGSAVASVSALGRADPLGTTVQVDAYGRQEVTLERYAVEPGGKPGWDPVCVAPCVGHVDPHDNLRLRLDGGDAERFHVEGAAAYRATFQPVSWGKLAGGTGLVLASWGILVLAADVGIERTEGSNACRVCLVGGGILSLGTLATGVALIIMGAGSHVRVTEQTTSAFAPRLSWRGVDFLAVQHVGILLIARARSGSRAGGRVGVPATGERSASRRGPA